MKADVDEPNVISVRILEKLGMRHVSRAIVAGRPLFYYEDKTRMKIPLLLLRKRVFFAIEGDPSYFYDWMQFGECPEELRNCDASNFIK